VPSQFKAILIGTDIEYVLTVAIDPSNWFVVSTIQHRNFTSIANNRRHLIVVCCGPCRLVTFYIPDASVTTTRISDTSLAFTSITSSDLSSFDSKSHTKSSHHATLDATSNNSQGEDRCWSKLQGRQRM
jgi:hypothetical protein